MTSHTLDDAARHAIEQACEKLARQYALFVDSGDYDALETLFARDASFARPTAPDAPIIGRDAIMEGFRKRPQDRVTRHLVSNCVIEAHSPTTASGRSYVTLFQGPRAENGELPVTDKPAMIGGFTDRFVLENGAWRFQQRIGDLALKTP